jgi:predicted RNA-binding Zn-ribbon protein involved in translation (DUF1610 family)
MPERVPRCTSCNVAMELGYMPDVMPGGYTTPTWVASEPVKSRWRGLKVKAPLGVTTHRCPNCGYLAS